MTGLDPIKKDEYAKTEINLPEAGITPARCFAIVDIGKHHTAFNGIISETASHMVFIGFEIPSVKNKFGKDDIEKPYTIWQKYTYSANEKAKLPKVLKSWGKLKALPEVIELRTYLGQWAALTLEEYEGKNEKKGVKIAGNGAMISPMMKGAKVEKAFYANIFFELNKFDWEVFNELPKFIQEEIKKSKEWPSVLKQNPQPIVTNNSSIITADDDVVMDDGDGDTPSFA